MLDRAGDQFEVLIASLVSNTVGLEAPSVTHRIKDREESIKKFSRKYQTDLEHKESPYEIRGYITDLIGLRVVCYYEPDILKLVELLRNNFEVIEETDKTAELEAKESEFGYKGYHLDLKINGERAKLPEYQEFQDFQFEVQVRSLIQDAWSVLDHKIKYKQSIPHGLKRKISALAALFEIADREFSNIRELTEQLRENRAKEVDSGTSNVSAPLDVFQFLAVAQKIFSEYPFHGYKADGFVQELLRWDPRLDAQGFKEAMDEQLPTIKQYCDFQGSEHGNELNPYTQIRHVLYKYDPKKYRLALYDLQRTNFEDWLNRKGDEV